MKSLVILASLPLAACFGGERASTGKCPAGEVCSPSTPNGLHFIGQALVDDILVTGPAPTAIGGTQDVALQYDRGNGLLIALDLPYDADDDGGAGIRIDHTTGSVVTVRGAGSRTNYLRIVDPADGSLYDRKLLTGAALDRIALVDTGFERIPNDAQLVWASGRQTIGVALFGQVQESSGPVSERLVDQSMQLDLAGSERTNWDVLRVGNAVPGTYPIAVTAGDKPAAQLDWTVVDHADALVAINAPPTIHQSAEVCFQATSNGRYIVGLAWTFVVDGTTVSKGASDPTRNCIVAQTTKTSGTVTVQAMAGGQSATVTLTVGAMARELPPIASHIGNGRAEPTAGDRAAL